MADEIRVDYAQLQEVAARFARQATAINQVQQQLKSKMGHLQSAWVGKGSAAFFAEMNDKVLPATARLYNALQEASKTTKQISQLLEQAEKDAAAPFKNPAERWDTMTQDQKEQALQDIANDIADQYGLGPIRVSVEQIPDPQGLDAHGGWDGSKIRIDIDNLNNPDDVIDTVAHEARHAVQQSIAEKVDPSLWDRLMRRVGSQETPTWPQYGITEETARRWSENRDNYKSPPPALNAKNPDSSRQMNEYLNQAIERDARDYAKQYIDRLKGAVAPAQH
jgi:WXG100 family type VII secretion target